MNPRHKHERPFHSPKLTVWAAMSTRGLIGSYFFSDESGGTVIVNSERYVEVINNFLTPALQDFVGFNCNNMVPAGWSNTSHV